MYYTVAVAGEWLGHVEESDDGLTEVVHGTAAMISGRRARRDVRARRSSGRTTPGPRSLVPALGAGDRARSPAAAEHDRSRTGPQNRETAERDQRAASAAVRLLRGRAARAVAEETPRFGKLRGREGTQGHGRREGADDETSVRRGRRTRKRCRGERRWRERQRGGSGPGSGCSQSSPRSRAGRLRRDPVHQRRGQRPTNGSRKSVRTMIGGIGWSRSTCRSVSMSPDTTPKAGRRTRWCWCRPGTSRAMTVICGPRSGRRTCSQAKTYAVAPVKIASSASERTSAWCPKTTRR